MSFGLVIWWRIQITTCSPKRIRRFWWRKKLKKGNCVGSTTMMKEDGWEGRFTVDWCRVWKAWCRVWKASGVEKETDGMAAILCSLFNIVSSSFPFLFFVFLYFPCIFFSNFKQGKKICFSPAFFPSFFFLWIFSYLIFLSPNSTLG